MSSSARKGEKSRFEALIVDFGGVLTTPMQDAMVRFADELGIELQDLVRAALGAYSGGEDRLVVDFETGRISEEEFALAFAHRLESSTGRPVDPEGLVGRIFRLEIEESMMDLVGAARASGYRTALCSNSWGTRLYPRDRLGPIFDVIVISGEVGLRKPDRAIFELTTDKLGVAPEACVFVDDHPGHLSAALEVGMTTVLHRTPDQSIAEVSRLLDLPTSPT
ncbi:MAG: HAD family phosphatase [Actinomycetota bacterium]|nr:HAD family phosphatase [Actinomycetota bacterium]